MRLRRTVTRAMAPAAILLCTAVVAVLAVKLLPLAGAGSKSLMLAAAAAVTAAWVFLAVYVRSPVAELAAASELDRLAGLKERAASLLAVRQGRAAGAHLAAELERDLGRALRAVDERAVLARAGEMPRGLRWMGLVSAALGAALLMPPRRSARAGALADRMLDGATVMGALDAAASGAGQEVPGNPAEAARQALRLVRAEPPSGAAETAKRAEDLREVARELRRAGRADLAARLEAAAAALIAPAPAGTGDNGETAPRAAGTGPADAGRYPAEYRELLARYYSDRNWNGGGGNDSIPTPETDGRRQENGGGS